MKYTFKNYISLAILTSVVYIYDNLANYGNKFFVNVLLLRIFVLFANILILIDSNIDSIRYLSDMCTFVHSQSLDKDRGGGEIPFTVYSSIQRFRGYINVIININLTYLVRQSV
jgi:hypothetical protein